MDRSATGNHHPMLLAQISDTHLLAKGAAAEARADNLACAVRAIAALDPAPVAVLHTGDVTHNGLAEEYALARRLLAPLEPPLFTVPGNRDDRVRLRQAFPPPAGSGSGRGFMQYAADLGPLRIVAADTLHGTSGLGAMEEARLAELLDLLDRDQTKPTLVLIHHPPVVVPELPDPIQFADHAEAHRLNEALASRPSIIATFAGHTHRPGNLTIGRAPIHIMESIAVDLRRWPAPAEHGGRPIVHLHEINGRRVTSRTILA